MCINQRIRSKKNIKYIYCIKKKKEVTYDICNNCNSKEHKKVKPIKKSKVGIKKKSSKVIKMERNRFSILTDDLKHCYICHKCKDDLHEVYGGSNRQTSIKNGFVIPVCRNCHIKVTDNVKVQRMLQIMMQAKYETEYSREEFMKIIGKSYL